MKISRESADSYWWYRLVRVIYIIGSVLGIILLVLGAYETYPQISYYDSEFSVQCDDLSIAPFGHIEGKNVFYTYRRNAGFEFLDSDNLDSYSTFTKYACEHNGVIDDGAVDSDTYSKYKSKAENYKLFVSKTVLNGSWTTFLVTNAIYLIVSLILLIKVIPMIFGYIIFGRKKYSEAE